MSAVTDGLISTLPDHSIFPPKGMMCDEHPDTPAFRRVQGETDSFGAEWIDLCQPCVNKHKSSSKLYAQGYCDWCYTEATDLRPRRDFEEGMYGRVYDVCGSCIDKDILDNA